MAIMWYIGTSLFFFSFSTLIVKLKFTSLVYCLLYTLGIFFPTKQNDFILDKLERCPNYFVSTCLEFLSVLFLFSFFLFSKQIQRTGNIQNNNIIVQSKIGRDLIFLFCFLRVKSGAWYMADILSLFIQETSWVSTKHWDPYEEMGPW